MGQQLNLGLVTLRVDNSSPDEIEITMAGRRPSEYVSREHALVLLEWLKRWLERRASDNGTPRWTKEMIAGIDKDAGELLAKMSPARQADSASDCSECRDYDRVHDASCKLHPDYDPTPYCTVCGDGSGICCTNPQAEND